MSSFSPPTDKTARVTPRLRRSASIFSSSATLSASLSGEVQISVSPSRRERRHSASFGRGAVLADCSLTIFCAPAAPQFASLRCQKHPRDPG